MEIEIQNLNDGTISLEGYFNKILDFHQFEPKKNYVEEIVDTDESDASSVDEDTDDEESEEEYESHHTDSEEIFTNEILSVANAIEEEVVVAVVIDDGKVACDICGKRYKVYFFTAPPPPKKNRFGSKKSTISIPRDNYLGIIT